MNLEDCLGRKTLIAGEVNSGKTVLTLSLLRALLATKPGPVALVDLAPETTRGVGGKLPLGAEEKKEIHCLSPRVLPPRLLGKTEEETADLARQNRERIDEVLAGLGKRDWAALFVNDLSLYLHQGDWARWISLWQGIPTVVMNGYYGRFFGESVLSLRERSGMEALMARCDRVLFLPSRAFPGR